MTRKPLNAVKAVSVIGSAKVLNIAFGLVKMKVAAVLLGPAGVGLIGLFQQLMGTVSTLFGMGLDKSGTRQIANARGSRSEQEFATVRRALFWGTICLALAGAAFLFLARDLLAIHVLQAPLQRAELGWLAIGVALTVGAASQQALLNGLRHVRELAQITALTGAVSAVIATGAMLLWREYAVIIFVLASPFASFVLGHVFVARLPRAEAQPSPAREVAAEFTTMLRLGSTIMLAALVVAAGHLAVRTLIQRELGAEALGLFTAAWLISQYYIGFLYTAITMDYYPRLTAALEDKTEAFRIINEQTEIGLLLAGPIIMAVVSSNSYILHILYSEEFTQASDVLAWLLIGDLIKVIVYPLEFYLMAAAMTKFYLATRTLSVCALVLFAFLLLPNFAMIGGGMAYFFMYLVLIVLLALVVRSRSGFVFSGTILKRFGILFMTIMIVAAISLVQTQTAAILGLVATSLISYDSYRSLRKLGRV